jgi:magnesium chelatase subunit I
LNELPDLAERIQVALFNVLEERDIQVRGYSIRLPLDVFLLATANPEDYTNRGRIITPLKDRFGAEIRTHYLTELPDELALLRQEAKLTAEVGDHLLEILARFTRNLRESASVDQRSGVSARFTIAAAEAVAASALRRSARTGDSEPVARICDVAPVLPTLLGKVEFEMGEEGRERAVLDHLLRLATAATYKDRLAGLDLSGFTAVFSEGAVVETGELVAATDVLGQLGSVPGLFKVLSRLGYDDGASRGQVAAAAEFTLEGLYLTRRLDKQTVGDEPSTGQPDHDSSRSWRLTAHETIRNGATRTADSGTGRGPEVLTRWLPRTTSGRRSTGSVRMCCRPVPSAMRCATCCGLVSTTEAG